MQPLNMRGNKRTIRTLCVELALRLSYEFIPASHLLKVHQQRHALGLEGLSDSSSILSPILHIISKQLFVQQMHVVMLSEAESTSSICVMHAHGCAIILRSSKLSFSFGATSKFAACMHTVTVRVPFAPWPHARSAGKHRKNTMVLPGRYCNTLNLTNMPTAQGIRRRAMRRNIPALRSAHTSPVL